VKAGPDGPHVPRAELVSTLQILLQARRLRVIGALPESRLLAAERASFREKSPANEMLDEWREGPGLDLVVAVALGAWLGENRAEPYTGPLVDNCWAPWPRDEPEAASRPKSVVQEVFEDLDINPDGEW
jgi:hypothetical protein